MNKDVRYIVVKLGENKVLFGKGDVLENITKLTKKQLPYYIKSFARVYGFSNKGMANKRLKKLAERPNNERCYVVEMRVKNGAL